LDLLNRLGCPRISSFPQSATVATNDDPTTPSPPSLAPKAFQSFQSFST
jgi:hypothetical protein